jgi:alkylation response protein AidB-like acyl-CoA dehydrogenase
MDFTYSEEQKMIQQLAREIAREKVAPRAAEIDEKEEFPHDLMQIFMEQGLIGLIYPEEYGGSAAGTLAYMLVIEEIAQVCASTATVYAGQGLGSYPILLTGNKAQKDQYLPDIASGAKLCAFALTEPNAGSDAAAIQTTAVLKNGHYILNGTKQWITSGDVAEVLVVFAMTDKTKGVKGISTFIIEKSYPGFSVGKKERKMGIRGSSTVELNFDNCSVPAGNLLGQEGDGFKIAMQTLDRARPSVGAIAVGIAQGAFDVALEYGKQRVQFGQPIVNFQGIQFMLADMATQIQMARLGVHQVAWLIESGAKNYTKESAMCKLYASDICMQVTTDSLQIMGGNGYSREYPLERMMRDAKITQIFEGTNQIQRIVIANQLIKGSK